MSGMSLRTGVSIGASFNPSLPVAAKSPSAPNGNSHRTMAQRAYGISGGKFVGKPHAAAGAVGFGIFSLAALVFIWWSLPR